MEYVGTKKACTNYAHTSELELCRRVVFILFNPSSSGRTVRRSRRLRRR